LVFDRFYGLPIERPSSFPLEWFAAKAKAADEAKKKAEANK
jgi:hypothetical protein